MRRLLCFVVVLVLAGCNSPSTPQKAKRYSVDDQRTQGLLNSAARANAKNAASGDREKPVDPLEAHLWARRQVDPSDRSSQHEYTAKVGDDGVVRPASGLSRPSIVSPPVPRHKPFQVVQAVQAAAPAAVVETVVPQPKVKPAFKPVRGLNAKPTVPVKYLDEGRTAGASRTKPYSGGGLKIESVRIGNHPGKTRIVFDAGKPVKFSVKTEDGGTILVVEFDNAMWGTAIKKSYGGHKVLSRYDSHATASGAAVAFDLKKPVEVTSQYTLPPNDVYKNHRIVVDVSVL